jgi:hypothetical protein
MDAKHKLNYLLAIAGVFAGATAVSHAQLQVAGSLLIDVDATNAPLGALTAITNNGTLGGFFEPRGDGTMIPAVTTINGNGTRGITFDGNDFLQHVASVGGALVPADPTLTGVNPTCTIEVWVLNPGVDREESVISWGRRGGPDGSNMSFNYGWDARFGAVGHWGAPDLGWDSAFNNDFNPPGTPRSGQWHHLVYTFDGAVQRVYADGVEKNSENVGLNIHTIPPVTIGAQMATDTTVEPALRGALTIGRFRIHADALTGAQVASNYNLEVSSFSHGGSPLPAGPSHRYSFTNAPGAAPDGSVVQDSIGSAHGVVRGGGATFTGGRLSLPGGAATTAAYVDLPNYMLSTNSVDKGGSGGVTFEAFYKLTGNRTWARVFDFGSSDIDPTAAVVGGEVTGPGGGGEGLDYLFLSAQSGGDVNRREADIRNQDPVQTPGAPDAAGRNYATGHFNRDVHVALSWDEASGQVVVYENGTTIANFSAGTNRMSSINDVNCWLGRAQWSGDQVLQGEFDEFRIYPRVLPPEQVRASFAAGPDSLATADPVSFVTEPQSQTIPEFGNVTFTVLAQGAPPLSVQWYKNGSELVGSNGNSIAFTTVPLSENGAQYQVVASNNIGGTAYYATSQVATLIVLADTNPPTLVQGRVNGTNVIEVVFSEAVNAADIIAGNFTITGTNAPNVIGAAVGSSNTRAVLTLDGPLTGCEFYTVTASNVRDLSAGENVTSPPGNSVVIWVYVADGLTHRYTFNQSPDSDATGDTVYDMVGEAHGIVLNGSGTTAFTGSRVTLSGGPSSIAPYIDLPNGLLSTNSVANGGSGKVTYEGWVKVTAGRTWSRVLDFGNSTAGELFAPGGSGNGQDYLFYSAQEGDNVNRHIIVVREVDPLPDGSSTGADQNAGVNTTTFQQDFQFVVTWDEATGQVTVYENGVQVGAFVSGTTMNEVHDVNVWLGRSNWTGDQNLQGEFDEFRVYNTVLSPQQVAFNKLGGPDNNFGAPLSLDLVVTNVNFITNTLRRAQVLVNFSNLGTQDVAGASCINYSSSDSNVVVLRADGMVHALNEGVATITASVGGFSDSVEITVFADTTAPEILAVRALGPRLVELIFSEPLDPGIPNESSNFSVDSASGVNVPILSSAQGADPSRVYLTLSADLPREAISVYVDAALDVVGNFMFSTTVQFLNYLPFGLEHRYSFNAAVGSAGNGSVVLDSIGTADGTVRGAGATFTGDRVTLPGGASAAAAYIDLPNGLLSTNSTANGGSGKLSLETWVKVTGARNWGRIFDFGSSIGGEVTGPGGGGEGRDYLMLSASIGTDVLNRRTELRNEDPGGGGIATVDHVTVGFTQMVHVIITWDEVTDQILTYENNALVSTLNVDDSMADINDVNVWLGRSNWTGDENMQGEFDEFRFYSRILSAEERAFNAAVGPDYNLGLPLALRIEVPTNFMHSGQSQQVQVFGDFANISNVNLTVSRLFTITPANPSVITADAAGVLYAVGSGTTDVSATFSGLASSTVTIVVNASPIGGDDGFNTSTNTPVTISLATLLANDSDPDGNTPLTLVASATSTNGGTIVTTATDLTYTPVSNYVGPDLFTYTITDTLGGSDVVNVFVYVAAGPLPDLDEVGIYPHAGGYAVAFRGVPGTSYQIQRTDNLTPPITWTSFPLQIVPPNGIIGLQDTNASPGQAFYRAVSP